MRNRSCSQHLISSWDSNNLPYSVKWMQESLPGAWDAVGVVCNSPKLLPAQGNSSRSICSVLEMGCSWSSIEFDGEIPVSTVLVTLRSLNSSTMVLWIHHVAAWKLPTRWEDEWVLQLGCMFFSRRPKWMRHTMIVDRLHIPSVKCSKCRIITYPAE